MRNLGLIGGLGPPATIHYYRELSKAQPGEMLLVHADVERVLDAAGRGDREGLAEYLARLIERLKQGGADFAAISAVTPHMCIRELEKISALPIVNIIAEIQSAVHARGYRRVALFGTRFVVASRMFGMLQGVDVIVPDQVDTIHDAYLQIVAGNPDARAILSGIAQQLPVDAVLLAGTDLSTVFDETNTDFPHLDCAKVHIEAILRELR